MQCALRMDTDDKRTQELRPLLKSGDFFRKIVVTEGYGQPLFDSEGILHVGAIPFLEDERFLEGMPAH